MVVVDQSRGVDSVFEVFLEGSLTEAPFEEEAQAQLAHPPLAPAFLVEEQAILRIGEKQLRNGIERMGWDGDGMVWMG